MYNLYKEIIFENNRSVAIHENGKYLSYSDLYMQIHRYYNLIYNIKNQNNIGINCKKLSNYIACVYACYKANKVAVPLIDKARKEQIVKLLDLRTVLTDAGKVIKKNNSIKEVKHNNKIALILFSSGTTSKFLKGIYLSHKSISHVCAFMNKKMNTNNKIVEKILAPFDHAFAIGRIHSVLSAGGTIIVPSNFLLISQIIDDIKERKCNAISLIPILINTILKFDKVKLNIFKKYIKCIQIGSMRLSPDIRKTTISLLSKTRIFYHYGMTEAMRTTFIELNKEKHKIHTEGKPIDGVRIKILNNEKKQVSFNQIGLIEIEGKNLFSGYLDRNNESKQIIKFLTSDLGYLDEDSYLVYVGRNDDIINVNGKLLNLIEVEDKIKRLISKKNIILIKKNIQSDRPTLIIEGKRSEKMLKLINNKLNAANIFVENIKFIKIFPRTKTLKVIKNRVLDILENEKI